MINLPDLAHWVDRIKAECPSLGGRVFKTIPDDELTIDQHQSPVAFVYLSSQKSNESSLVNKTRQRTLHGVTVETVYRRTASKDDKFNEAVSNQIDQARRELFAALLGWQPPDCMNPVEHSDGELKKKEKKQVHWNDVFTTDNYQSK